MYFVNASSANSFVLKDPILRNWKAKQRLMYQKGDLSTNKINLLENIGFDFNPVENDWVSKFRELKSFKNEFKIEEKEEGGAFLLTFFLL